MMKRFTLTLMGLLILLGGTNIYAEDLLILGGNNWKAMSLADPSKPTNQRTYGSWSSKQESDDFYKTAVVKIEGEGNNWGSSYVGGSGWKANFEENTTHTFEIIFTTGGYENGTVYTGPSGDLKLQARKSGNVIQTVDISAGASSAVLVVSSDYDEVGLIKTASNGTNIIVPIASITRTISSASSVAAPTISPESGTYDEDKNLSVTINKGEGNDDVVYSVSGATSGNATNVHFTAAELTAGYKTLTLTGTGTITVTATGYENSEASTTVTNTYTTDVPSGKISIASDNYNHTLPCTFNSADDNIEFNSSRFNNENIVTGNYVVLDINVANDNTWFCFKRGYGSDYFKDCTSIYSGNSANDCWVNKNDKYWWMKISDQNAVNAFIGNNVQINGSKIKDANTYSEMTVNSFSIYESKAISESENNIIASKINNVVVELTRSFVAGTWNTVCLPFSLTSAQATQLFGEGYQLAEFTGVSGTTLQFTKTNTFAAGVPYLVWPTASLSNGSPVVLIDVNITAKTPQPVPIDGYSFVGNFTQKSFNSGERSTTRFVGANNTLLTPNDESAMKSLRCYFTVPAGAQARSFTIDEEEGGTTNINAINGEGFMVNGYYNLNGQRVAQPTKGLFIVNGKKVVIK